MSSKSELLVDNSLQAMLASIEIYNKPDFKYREQVFSILNVNAWELLLKAKILKDNADDLSSLYIIKDGNTKRNRSGNPMTIEILACLKRLALNNNVTQNIESLVDIRDTVVHFYHDDSLSYLVYTLGAASLRNYQKLIKDWFDRSLLEYNFYILPLAFSYNFKTLSMIELDTKPEIISNLIKSVSSRQESLEKSEDFYFVCEVATEIKSAKKFMGDSDFITTIDSTGSPTTPIVALYRRPIDKYPITYTELFRKVCYAIPGVKQTEINQVIKDYKIKDDPKYSIYNFWSKSNEDIYEKSGILPKGTPSIYNEDAVRFVIEKVKEYNSRWGKTYDH